MSFISSTTKAGMMLPKRALRRAISIHASALTPLLLLIAAAACSSSTPRLAAAARPVWSRNGRGVTTSSSSSSSSSSSFLGRDKAAVRTTLTFRRPSAETGRRIFGRCGGGGLGGGGGGCRLAFNHDSVGLTNPCLHVAVAPTSAHDDGRRVDDEVGRADGDDGDEPSDGWWFPPPAAVSEGGGGGGGNDGEWRVLRYRRRVGSGERCYAAVRDAALEWEFRSSSAGDGEEGSGGSGSVGIIKVPRQSSASSASSSSRDGTFLWRPRPPAARGSVGCAVYDNVPYWNDCAGLDEPLTGDAARNVMQIWPGGSSSSSGSSSPVPGRRLITYSETILGARGKGKMKIRLPSLFVSNPVAVAYDLVDQPGDRDCETYTSTAYATLSGHLLSGEERVTVALRSRGGSKGGRSNFNCRGDGAVVGSGAALSRITAGGTSFGENINMNSDSGGNSGGGYVDVEILSYSRAGPSLLGRLAWPLIGRMQDQFFYRQMDALERVAKGAGNKSSSRGDAVVDDAKQ